MIKRTVVAIAAALLGFAVMATPSGAYASTGIIVQHAPIYAQTYGASGAVTGGTITWTKDTIEHTDDATASIKIKDTGNDGYCPAVRVVYYFASGTDVKYARDCVGYNHTGTITLTDSKTGSTVITAVAIYPAMNQQSSDIYSYDNGIFIYYTPVD
jgi:hypothetical protein